MDEDVFTINKIEYKPLITAKPSQEETNGYLKIFPVILLIDS